jgi:hypothetical protein
MLLSIPKERVVGDLHNQQYRYFAVKRIDSRRVQIQLFTRLEGLRTWTELRKAGLCGLTPDEKSVIVSLLEGAAGTVECVTDFFSEASSPMRFARRQYYRSVISIDEFVSTLRTVSRSSRRNCYLPRESILRVRVKERFDIHPVLDGLGEWCFFEYSSKNL